MDEGVHLLVLGWQVGDKAVLGGGHMALVFTAF